MACIKLVADGLIRRAGRGNWCAGIRAGKPAGRLRFAMRAHLNRRRSGARQTFRQPFGLAAFFLFSRALLQTAGHPETGSIGTMSFLAFVATGARSALRQNFSAATAWGLVHWHGAVVLRGVTPRACAKRNESARVCSARENLGNYRQFRAQGETRPAHEARCGVGVSAWAGRQGSPRVHRIAGARQLTATSSRAGRAAPTHTAITKGISR
jgi:hypothetical protein